VYQVQSVTVAEGQAPVVTFRATDSSGAPFDLIGEMTATPRRINPSFVLSRLGPDGKYTSYLTRTATGTPFGPAATAPALPTATQAAAESSAPARMTGGENGVYTYTFAAPVTGVDAAATHRLAMYGTRTFADRTYPSATTFDFNPSGGAVNEREVVSDDACNRCHTVVNAHGGARRGVRLCLTCHSPQTVDPETGNNVDMALMIHKIHKGRLLENGYTIIGNRGSVHDFSHVAMGPSHNTYFEGSVSDRGIIRECQLCHQGTQAESIRTALSATTCTTCHDDVNPGTVPLTQNGVTVAPGFNHVAVGPGSAFGDNSCVLCHGPGETFGVAEVHTPNYAIETNALFPNHTFALKIDAVNDVVAGGATPPSVDFTLSLDGAAFNARTNAASLGALAFQIAGPVTDYAENIPSARASVQSALADDGTLNAQVTDIDAAAGKFRFTFAPATGATTVIPAGRTGVYVVAFESYYKQTIGAISKPYAADPVFRGADKNVAYVNVADGAPSTTERRLIVANAKCNNCHEDIGFHSNRSRQGVDYCATCHNPNLDNATRIRFQPSQLVTVPLGPSGTPTEVFIPESVSTNVFIHKIHMGAELSRPYRLGTARTGTIHTPEEWLAEEGEEAIADFSEFEAPSPMGNCQTCHEGETFVLPTTPNLLPVKQSILDCGPTVADSTGALWCSGRTANATQGVRYTPPQQAVCMGCHDTAFAKAHFDLNTLYPAGQTAAAYNPYNVIGGTGAPRPPGPADAGSALPDPAKTAIETCATCHGAGRDFDVVSSHPPVLLPTAQIEETP
jgi:OmcA/MtrC family decaheme c-type cytochrome